MVSSLRQDASWHSGEVDMDRLYVTAGWACRPGPVAGRLPFWNEDRSICLILNDEELSVAEDLAEPLAALQQIEARAAALLRSYEESGIEALLELNGWFSGLLLDLRQQTSILFNDRYGLGRLYYTRNDAGFHFSSAARSLLAVCPETRKLDDQGVAEWLSCGCVLQDRSLFRNIFLIPAGAAWTFHPDGRMDRHCYFERGSWEKQVPVSPDTYYEELREVFPRALSRAFRGSQPIAMSLTGGIDGRMIMAWTRKQPGELPCYTFNGPVRDCEDVRIARMVARACGQPFQTIQIKDDFFSSFPTLAAESVRLTDGAMDVSGAAELYLNRRARAVAPIRLTGNYGSEVVRGNVAFRPREMPRELFSASCLDGVTQAGRTYAGEAEVGRLSFIAFKQTPWHHYARFAVERSQLTPRSPYLDNELMALLFRAPRECSTSLGPSLRLIAEGNPQMGDIPTDRGVTYPVNRWSNRVQRPFQEFLAKAEYAYDYGMPDWLARVDSYLVPLQLERLFLGRQKFCHFRSWYRRELAGFVREVLLDPQARTRPYLNSRALEQTVETHIRGTRNRTTEIHKLLSLELIHRELLA